jgi:aromatic-L-amino-acid decarboxylase
VLRTWGVEGLQEHIRHHLKLGELFADLVKSRSDLFSIFTPPAFALTVLTVNAKKGQRPRLEAATNGGDPRTYEESHQVVDPEPKEEDLQKANEATKEVFEIIDGKKEFFLTSTVIGGVFSIRVVSANPLAEEMYVRKVFEELVEAAERVL